MFELTYRCNFRCKHCYVPQSYSKKKGELKTKEVFSILDQLKDIGCFYLGFTGGEPFLRKDIIEILWYTRKLGFEIIIYTNGSLINKKIAEELVRLRLNKVDITIPAMSKIVFERITGIAGSRDKVFGAINLLYKNGVNLGFKTCVLKENESEIKDIQDLAVSLGALHRLDDMLFPRLDGSREPYKYRGNRFAAHTAHRTPHIVHRPPSTDNLFKCGVGVSQAAITPFGELKMCLMIDYPKYKILHVTGQTSQVRRQKRNLKDAWERLKELAKSIKPDENYKCNECELKPYCKWCPARAWLEDRNFTSCEPQSRTFAENQKV